MVNQSENCEYEMTDGDFQYLQDLIRKQTGIVLNDSKRKMLYRRLLPRLQELNVPDFKAYCQTAASNRDELLSIVNAITTNVTRFFREDAHFNFLGDAFIPALLHDERPDKTVYIWSAGCSMGQEPYTIALSMHRFLKDKRVPWDFKVLATDIDSNVLNTAKAGRYPIDALKEIPTTFQRGVIDRDADETFQISADLRKRITFNKLNLMDDRWPIKRQMDIIFCRNVMIYFSPEDRARLIQRYTRQLAVGGYLIIGHSESVSSDCTNLDYVQGTIYRKISE